MKDNNNLRSILLCTALVLFAVMTRVINVQAGYGLNFACVGAIGIFSGAILKNKVQAYILPLAAYLLSDLYIQFVAHKMGFYGMSQYFVYGAMMLVVLLGTKMGQPKALKVLGFSIAGSAIFWIVSNFGVWVANMTMSTTNPIYEDGLTLGFTYWRALPFYNEFGRNLFLGTFVSDLAFSSLLFGAYALLKNKVASPKAIAG